MKGLFIALALLFAIVAINAQDYTINKVGAPIQIVTIDTIANTGTDNVTVLLRIPDESFWDVAVMSSATGISGTVDIDVNYQASMDNVVFYTLTSDSLAAGNLTYVYEKAKFPGRYLKVVYTGVGTQSTKFSCWAYVSKQ